MTDPKAAIVVNQLVDITHRVQTLIQFLAGDNSQAALKGLEDLSEAERLAEEAAILESAGDGPTPSL